MLPVFTRLIIYKCLLKLIKGVYNYLTLLFVALFNDGCHSKYLVCVSFANRQHCLRFVVTLF